ncbi:unnamed protein product [Gongylonema pulchrum]|uniref:Cysteine protease n=1 Tax=Gongylonema pulchrum TaxID=637853 RepID=A0A183DNB7_9BILA|nr:unnamed protein product [Gongylonema pulchrum]
MLRCGQMLLARALIVRHLGSDWLWNREAKEDDYKRILRMFQDKKSSLFSIHQIGELLFGKWEDFLEKMLKIL